jgi:hypothetical protein
MKQRSISLGSTPITARVVCHAQGISPADDGDKQMSTILPTENQDWGFWGTMREHAADAWPIAFTAIHNATSTDPASVRAFLDSRYGHCLNGQRHVMHLGQLEQFAPAMRPAHRLQDRPWLAPWRIEPIEPFIGIRPQNAGAIGQIAFRMDGFSVTGIAAPKPCPSRPGSSC